MYIQLVHVYINYTALKIDVSKLDLVDVHVFHVSDIANSCDFDMNGNSWYKL